MEITRILVVFGLLISSAAGNVGVLNHRWTDWYDKRIGILRESDIINHAQTYQQVCVPQTSTTPADLMNDYRKNCVTEIMLPHLKEPLNVHDMTVEDVDVVAALGDSFTAGTGVTATNLSDITSDGMEYSWITGGNPDQITIANLFQLFRRGSSTVLGASENGTVRFNMAKPGSVARDLPDQAQQLVDVMKSDGRVDISSDWKLITVYMGRNDLCWMCAEHDLIPSEYVSSLLEALEVLKSELPRSLVNVVLPPFIPLWEGPEGTRPLTQEAQSVLCPCLEPSGAEGCGSREAAMKQHHLDLAKVVTKTLLDASLTTANFSVVIQPCFMNLTMPLNANGDPDAQYFAPDYYHFNARGQAAMAIALWNGMFEHVYNKTANLSMDTTKIHCPTPTERIGTRWNTMIDRNITIEDPAGPKYYGSNELIVGLGVTIGLLLAAACVAVIIMMVTNDKQKRVRRESMKPVVDMDHLTKADKDDDTFPTL